MSRVSVLSENFEKALKIVGSTVGNRPMLPILAYVLLETKHQELILTTSNLNNASIEKIGAKVDEDFSVCVPYAQLMDIVALSNEIPAHGPYGDRTSGKKDYSRIDLEFQEKTMILTMRQDGSTTNFKCYPANEFPDTSILDEHERILIAEVPAASLKSALASMEKTITPDKRKDSTLENIGLTITYDAVRLFSSNRYVGTYATIPQDLPYSEESLSLGISQNTAKAIIKSITKQTHTVTLWKHGDPANPRLYWQGDQFGATPSMGKYETSLYPTLPEFDLTPIAQFAILNTAAIKRTCKTAMNEQKAQGNKDSVWVYLTTALEPPIIPMRYYQQVKLTGGSTDTLLDVADYASFVKEGIIAGKNYRLAAPLELPDQIALDASFLNDAIGKAKEITIQVLRENFIMVSRAGDPVTTLIKTGTTIPLPDYRDPMIEYVDSDPHGNLYAAGVKRNFEKSPLTADSSWLTAALYASIQDPQVDPATLAYFDAQFAGIETPSESLPQTTLYKFTEGLITVYTDNINHVPANGLNRKNQWDGPSIIKEDWHDFESVLTSIRSHELSQRIYKEGQYIYKARFSIEIENQTYTTPESAPATDSILIRFPFIKELTCKDNGTVRYKMPSDEQARKLASAYPAIFRRDFLTKDALFVNLDQSFAADRKAKTILMRVPRPANFSPLDSFVQVILEEPHHCPSCNQLTVVAHEYDLCESCALEVHDRLRAQTYHYHDAMDDLIDALPVEPPVVSESLTSMSQLDDLIAYVFEPAQVDPPISQKPVAAWKKTAVIALLVLSLKFG